MKICVAQTRPFKGDIPGNIDTHKKLIDRAVSFGTDFIVFPELSLTGYEPELAKELATDQEDGRLDDFQAISDLANISIGAGMPTRAGSDILISMIIFQPHTPRQTYSKQYLHEDEYPFFHKGQNQVFLTSGTARIAPAICYESLLADHADTAVRNGATIYMASVAKSARGVEKAYRHFPNIAQKYGMTVVMANCVGPCDNFESTGTSSIWNDSGMLAGQLNDKSEGILIFDTDSREIIAETSNHTNR